MVYASNTSTSSAQVDGQSCGQAEAAIRALCTVVTAFHHQCAVVAQDPAAGTPGIGWAIAPTLQAATKQAMANCMATAGKSRRQFCARDAYQCDTKYVSS